MRIENFKYALLNKLISIQDISLLEKVNDLIGGVDVNTPIFKISEDQKGILIKSEEDILNGNFTTDQELNEEEDKWLSE
ncbi:MAG TPA: hypothetical protein VGW31_12740 [Hanamia sp.]|nr:hypothetical protein [Hanamia sp.]